MDKLTAIKIKYDDGTYSDEIPISVLSENVEWDSTHTLVDVLGSIDVDAKGTIQAQIDKLSNNTQLTDVLGNIDVKADGTVQDQIKKLSNEKVSNTQLTDVLGNVDVSAKGTVQDQIDKLFNEKVSITQLNNYVASQLNTKVVRFDISQDLTDAEKAQARANIGVSSFGMTDAVKEALLDCFKHVAWRDAPGAVAYNNLQNALNGSSEPVKTYYTKWSTSPPDDTYGKLYVRSGIAVIESYEDTAMYEPSVRYVADRSAIFTDKDHSDYLISVGTYKGNDVYAIELPPRTTGFTATFSETSGSCFYVFKKNEYGKYTLESQFTRYYTDTETVTGLDPNSEYIIGGGSKVTSEMSVTITTTQS